jgi:hypothetical protein
LWIVDALFSAINPLLSGFLGFSTNDGGVINIEERPIYFLPMSSQIRVMDDLTTLQTQRLQHNNVRGTNHLEGIFTLCIYVREKNVILLIDIVLTEQPSLLILLYIQ